MSSVSPLKRCTTFLRLATSDTASATPEDQGPMMNFAPSPSTASSARRFETPGCVPPSRVMYLIGRPSTFMPRSCSAICMPRSLSGPTSAKAPVWSHSPSTTISFGCARTIAGKPALTSAAAAPTAPALRMSRRLTLLMSLSPCALDAAGKSTTFSAAFGRVSRRRRARLGVEVGLDAPHVAGLDRHVGEEGLARGAADFDAVHAGGELEVGDRRRGALVLA